MKFPALFAALFFLTLCSSVPAQNWPDKIRGYKIFDAKVSVTNSIFQKSYPDKNDAFVKLTDPTLAEIGFTDAIIEIGAEITSTRENGKVDFVTFRDIMVNGFSVDVADYEHSFVFKKGEPSVLPKPARISLNFTSLPRAIYAEIVERKEQLSITGTVFVFGRFKKLGFSFKRVVPININLKIKNPLGSR